MLTGSVPSSGVVFLPYRRLRRTLCSYPRTSVPLSGGDTPDTSLSYLWDPSFRQRRGGPDGSPNSHLRVKDSDVDSEPPRGTVLFVQERY